MTITEAMTDVFEQLGEPTDLEFRDGGTAMITLTGYQTLLRGLERGIIATLRYKEPSRGSRLKWPGSTKMMSVEGGSTVTLTVVSTAVNVITVVETVGLDAYLGYCVEVGTEYRRVVYSGGNTVVVASAFTTPPSGSMTLRKMHVDVSSVSGVLSVRDTTTSTALSIVRPEDMPWSGEPTLGDPTSYYHNDGKVYLDPPPSTTRYFLIEVEQDVDLSDYGSGDELPLPQPLHYAVVLWTAAWGFGRYLNPDMKASLRREWRETLLQTQLPEDNIMDRVDDAFTLRRS